MAVIIPQQGSTGFADRGPNGFGCLLPRDFLVQDLAIGEDATKLIAIPQPNSEFTLSGDKYTCDRTYVSKVISDNSCMVTTLFSNDQRFRSGSSFSGNDPHDPDYQGWDIGYRKTKYEIPRFTKGTRTYATSPGGPMAMQDYWIYTPIPQDIEYTTFSRVLNLTPVAPTQVIGIVNTIHTQVGHLHIFPNSPNKWLMNAPTIRNTKKFQLQVVYSWESDPGNGIVQNIDPNNFIVPDDERDPFSVYQVTAATVANPDPRIFVQQLFPPSSSRYDPNGWQTLPGHPI